MARVRHAHDRKLADMPIETRYVGSEIFPVHDVDDVGSSYSQTEINQRLASLVQGISDLRAQVIELRQKMGVHE